MKARLIYFKPDSGKFYSEAEYESQCQHSYELYSEVRTMRDRGILPGLVNGAQLFDIYIDPREGVPALITLARSPIP